MKRDWYKCETGFQRGMKLKCEVGAPPHDVYITALRINVSSESCKVELKDLMGAQWAICLCVRLFSLAKVLPHHFPAIKVDEPYM
jgi:hypothetical protein